MGIYQVKPAFQQLLAPIKNVLIHFRVHPTIINLTGLVFSIFIGVIFLIGNQFPWLFLLIPILAFSRTASNALDGLVARELRVKNQRFGEVLNELLDRISDTIIFLSLALSSYTHNLWGILALIMILLNSYLSIVSKAAGGSRQYGGVMGKADRMILISIFAGISLLSGNLIWWNFCIVILMIGTTITFIQRLKKTYDELVTD